MTVNGASESMFYEVSAGTMRENMRHGKAMFCQNLVSIRKRTSYMLEPDFAPVRSEHRRARLQWGRGWPWSKKTLRRRSEI